MFQIDGVLRACLPELCNLVAQTMRDRGWLVRQCDAPALVMKAIPGCAGGHVGNQVMIDGSRHWRDAVATLCHELTHHYDASETDWSAIRRLNSIPEGEMTDADWDEYCNFPWEVKARAIAEELRETACLIAAGKRLEQIKHKTGRHYRAEKTALLLYMRYGGRELGAFNWRNWIKEVAK